MTENSLIKKLEEAEYLNEQLKQENELLHNEIARLKRIIGVQKVFSDFASQSFGAAAIDLLVDPNPIEITCSGQLTDTSDIYSVRLMNILAIKSRKRPKDIYLRDALTPVKGGKPLSMITFDSNEVNFDKLLLQIQKNSHHLMRIHTSTAINIYHYRLSKRNMFILNPEYQNEENKEIHELSVSSLFNKEQYKTRLFEIEKLNEGLNGIHLSFEKLNEIQQLKEL